MSLRRTPLYDAQLQAGAKMVPFAGWDMPVQYEGALKEHLAVRGAAGLFDVSHMGEIFVSGTDALSFLQEVTCNDVGRLVDGQAQYSGLLYETGTFVDDILVYRLSQDQFFLCVNAANCQKDLDWLLGQATGNVRIDDRSAQYAQLALQGPAAQPILQSLTAFDLSSIRYYHFAKLEVNGVEALVSRTGYTGEDGFELYIQAETAESVWKKLLEQGHSSSLVPVGLAARNTLRLEVCFSLYGNDIDGTTTPLEAGLEWIVRLEKENFVGKAALADQKRFGLERKLVAFEIAGRGIARDHCVAYRKNGQVIGPIASGSYGPTVGKGIGLLYLPIDLCEPGKTFEIDVRGKRLEACVVPMPFYRRSKRL